ncbi:MAG: hypothetical protein IIC58_03260 [Proteobacteria bacterium]|nr:hypothetical protein [Pseudomonadota bacterium]
MKKIIAGLLLVSGLSVFAGQSFAANHESDLVGIPSFGFVQETAALTLDGDIRVDLFNNTNYRDMIRVGAYGGEIMISPDTGNAAHGLGYKLSINSNIAVYGMLFLDNDQSFTNITAGASYTTNTGTYILNGNVELFSQSDTGGGPGGGPSETFIDLRGSAFYRLANESIKGSLYLGGEIDMEFSPNSDTDVYIGVRWIPKRTVILDLGVFESLGGPNTSTVGTPVFFRLNIGF